MSFRSLRRTVALLAATVMLGAVGIAPVMAQSAAAGTTVTVVATDGHYEGLPTSVPVGTTFTLDNQGAEVHELLIARRNAGTTQSWDALLQMTQDQVSSLVTILDPLVADPGATATGTITVDQEGEYIAADFVPSGLTALPGPSDTPDPALASAPPHVLLGMRQVFMVTAAGSTPGPLPSAAPSAAPSVAPSAGAARIIELTATASLQFTDPSGAQVKEIPVTPGETITFKVTNTAGFAHDFTIGPEDALEAGQTDGLVGIPAFSEGTGEVTWTVPADVTSLSFGCTVPGHYQLMHGSFTIGG